ncbi:hypothetical protein FGO68_gene2933 [Halteria grandinella]|uniref:Uncharacterized protein n=1 Tax=Halteria grandinella TaxID=5974 RepID=A0A8J8NJ70_HALGN|nr:hypothetical protein FGO68_gene2933 [Halteria grandinella]
MLTYSNQLSTPQTDRQQTSFISTVDSDNYHRLQRTLRTDPPRGFSLYNTLGGTEGEVMLDLDPSQGEDSKEEVTVHELSERVTHQEKRLSRVEEELVAHAGEIQRLKETVGVRDRGAWWDSLRGKMADQWQRNQDRMKDLRGKFDAEVQTKTWLKWTVMVFKWPLVVALICLVFGLLYQVLDLQQYGSSLATVKSWCIPLWQEHTLKLTNLFRGSKTEATSSAADDSL